MTEQRAAACQSVSERTRCMCGEGLRLSDRTRRIAKGEELAGGGVGGQARTRELAADILEGLEERAQHIIWNLLPERLRLAGTRLEVAVEEAFGGRRDVSVGAHQKRLQH